jgi:CRP/FNR family transcriptional regulator, anaerobic regulatory protein
MQTATIPGATLVREHFKNTFETALLDELSQCPIVSLPAGEVMRHELQSRVRNTPLVLSGSIRVTRTGENGREILLYHIQAKESCFLNITASLNNDFGNVNALRAVTEVPTTMVVLSDAQIRAWHERYSSWRDYVSRLYHARIGEFFAIVDGVVFKRVDEKLIASLNALKDADNLVHATHQDLAMRIGSVREVVSRLLKTLERDGKVRLSPGCITILQPL